jgi:hypothetical protein
VGGSHLQPLGLAETVQPSQGSCIRGYVHSVACLYCCLPSSCTQHILPRQELLESEEGQSKLLKYIPDEDLVKVCVGWVGGGIQGQVLGHISLALKCANTVDSGLKDE